MSDSHEDPDAIDLDTLINRYLAHLAAGTPERPKDDDYASWVRNSEGWLHVVEAAILDDTEMSWQLLVGLADRMPSDHWPQFVWIFQDVLQRRADELSDLVIARAQSDPQFAFLLRNVIVSDAKATATTRHRLRPFVSHV